MYLTISEEILKRMSALDTAKEITQQPHTWNKTFKLIQSHKSKLQEFLNRLGKMGTFDIVLMGAGTSEYIGNTLEQYLNQMSHFSARSVASTDMILNPSLFVNPLKNTLFISYGRSGNSPESAGSVMAANSVTDHAYHLFITCNKDGALAKLAKGNDRIYAIELPEETNDLGFAMTSSFTNMLLATVLTFNLDKLDSFGMKIKDLALSVESDLNRNAEYIEKLVDDFNFERIIYLGSHCMKGFAQESALKVLELTAGRVSTLFDTPTGFRHGPKSFININSLIVIYLNDDSMTRKYELDLINEIKSQQKGYKICVIYHNEIDCDVDYSIQCTYNDIPMELAGLKMIVVAHLIGFFKSLSLGITVDNPCPTGEVNRVVTGVTIYPIERETL
jgi:tagatose-6-phosphate ketose/aldose isomerase